MVLRNLRNMKNPFEYGGVVTGNAFCNREKEVGDLHSIFQIIPCQGIIQDINAGKNLRSRESFPGRAGSDENDQAGSRAGNGAGPVVA